MKKILLVIATLLVLGIGAISLNTPHFFQRALFAGTLFTGVEQYERFAGLVDIFPTHEMPAAVAPFIFPRIDSSTSLPESFVYKAQQVNTTQFLQETDTSALLVIRDGTNVFEEYWLTGGVDVVWLSMSVAKSYIATGIGIAVDEGLIDIERDIAQYVPALEGSAYAGVRVKDVLQMSSGAAWNEDYTDINSDVMRMGRSLAFGNSLNDFVRKVQREYAPGTKNRYNSADTQALGMLLREVTGQTVAQYLQSKLWQPLGAESSGFWLVDNSGMEMVFLGLNATARDYAKLGQLYLNQGLWQGQRIVSRSWITQSVTPDAPHVMPNVHEDFPLGYGYQWWIPESTQGEFLAIGVYNQFIYVNPALSTVIVKLSANSSYGTSDDESAYREMESIAFFRATSKRLQQADTAVGQ